jgi:predicted transposase YdaD
MLAGGCAAMTPRPHDALFKSAFESPAHAAALLRELLPSPIHDAIAWNTLHREPGSFVDTALADRHSDLLFSARLHTGDTALLYLLLEHQSTSDAAMPLRILSYEIRVWDRIRKETPTQRLPPVIPVVISHVPGGWTTSRCFDDMLDPRVLAIPGLAALVPRFSLIIEDLAHFTDDELKARSLAAFQKLALWLLRDARDPARLLDSFGFWIDAILEAERAPGGASAFATLITYMFRVVDPMNQDQLRAKIRLLGPHTEESAMSIADKLHEEGRQEGRQEGRREARIATLRSQLLFKFQALDATYEARLHAAPAEALDRYLQRVLFANSLAAVFED